MYAEDGGTLNIAFEAMTRRSILDPISIARWTTSPSTFPLITSDVWLWCHITLALELSIDAIRVTLLAREKLEEVSSNGKPADRILAKEERFPEHIPGVPDDSEDDEDLAPDANAIDAANRALLHAVTRASEVCTHLVTAVISAIQNKRQTMAAVDELDPFIVTAISLLRSVLRTSIAAHSYLDDIANYLSNEGALLIFDPQRVTSLMPAASFTPTITSTWNAFMESS